MATQNRWLERKVIAYAHQGGAWEAPSSTLYAIKAAIEAGATAIELDVHATLDRELVVCHDSTVDRTTEGVGKICDLTIEELKAIDPAYWFIKGADVTPGRPDNEYPYRGRAKDDPDFQIATLREILETFPTMIFNLDIKETGPTVIPYESLLADLLKEFECFDRVIVASFLDLATEAFSQLAPEIPVSAGTLGTAQFVRAARAGSELPDLSVVALQVPMSFGEVAIIDKEMVEAAHGAGIAVHVWTINDEESVDRLIEIGVDGIISDLPTMLVEKLGAAGVLWNP